MLPLTNQSALVTGGGRRLGRSIALALAHAGAEVTLSFLSSEDAAVHTMREIVALGLRAQATECDVRSETSVQRLIQDTVSFHGRLDIVVNNAGLFETAPLDQLSVAQWDAVFETNARGPFLVSREALPHLRRTQGRIVNMGSLGGIRPWAGHAHYCASKAALHMLTQAMAKSFAPEVAVNCVAPGWIQQDEENEDTARRFAAKTPLARNGTADDVAQAVLYFASAAPFVTGQILTVDGGLGL